MPYKISKENGTYRISTPTYKLKGKYMSKRKALSVVRYLYEKENNKAKRWY